VTHRNACALWHILTVAGVELAGMRALVCVRVCACVRAGRYPQPRVPMRLLYTAVPIAWFLITQWWCTQADVDEAGYMQHGRWQTTCHDIFDATCCTVLQRGVRGAGKGIVNVPFKSRVDRFALPKAVGARDRVYDTDVGFGRSLSRSIDGECAKSLHLTLADVQTIGAPRWPVRIAIGLAHAQQCRHCIVASHIRPLMLSLHLCERQRRRDCTQT
jgi:hypothetical protein